MTGYEVRGVSDNTWSENTITYNNAPAVGGVTGMKGEFITGMWTEVTVTPLVTGNGLVSFAVTTASSTAMQFTSRNTTGTNAPQLIITLAATASALPAEGESDNPMALSLYLPLLLHDTSSVAAADPPTPEIEFAGTNDKQEIDLIHLLYLPVIKR